MANFSSRKEKKYNVDEIANQLIEQIKNNNVNSSNINIQETTKRNTNNNSSLWNTVKETANNNTSWFKKSEAYKDNKGNWISDTTATTLSTIGDIGTGLVKGVMNIGEGIGDLITYGRAQIKENKGDIQRANKLRQHAQKDSVGSIFEPIQTKLDKNSVLGNKSDNIVEGLGYVAGVTAIGIATGGAATAATTATTFSSAMGQGMNQAYQEGASNDDAWKYGVISGLAEAGTELLFGGLGKASGAVGLSKSALPVDDMVAKKVSGVFKSCLGKNLSQYVIKSGAEGTEEVISGVIQALGQKLTYKSSEEIGKLIKDQNLLEQFITGTATSAIAQIPGNNGIYKTTKDGREFIPNSTESEIESNNTSNLQPQSTQNQQILPTQQVNQQENKVAQNGNVKQILPMQRYVYEKSDNIKIDNLRQDASKYWDNSEKTRNYINMLEKIIQDKNIDIRLDANLTDSKGNFANGSYSNGVITINPNSTRTGEFIAVHELTHAIGTNSMKNIIETYRRSNPEFDTAVKGLLQNYEGTEISEEALSNISAQLFGNQEFINNIAQNNPNIFQKLYSEIKYLWHQFRGYKNQDQFVEDLYYKWTQAYNSSNKLNETSNYYIETIEDFDEIKYNNAKELKLPKREYAILSGIVNSDSNIKPGINYVETTNATYEVYFKETGEFKVVGKIVDGGYYDTITNGNIQGTRNTGNAKSGMQVHSSTIQQSRTGTRNDEISNFNQKRTRISDTSIGNGSSNSSNVKYSIQESENNLNIKDSNKSSFSFEKINSKITTDSNINKLTDKGITMTYVHMNNQNTQYYGTQYGQNIEPSGEYMNVDTMQGKYKVPGAEYGTISFKNPLVLDHINTGETGWKKTLSDMFDGKTGKKLSKAIKDAGYDGIITIDEDGNYSEIVNINGKKIDNQESENNSGSFFNSEDFKKYILPEIKERYQYENKNKITETIEELKKRKETLDIDTDEGWDNNFIINQKIKALENGYDTIYDYLIEHDINELKKDYKYNPKILTDKINRVKQTEKKQEKLQKEIEEATPIKRAQYEIIQKTNPMFDDEHVGIRSPADIKTFEEAIQDDESFSWGDYTKEDAERDLKRNKVKIYSSYAIKNGVFVSTSYQQALDYAGGDRAQVHSKEISPNRVAWINGDEGQYASINAKYFIENQTWQSYLDKNYKPTGTRTNLEDIKLPTKQEVRNVPVNEEKRVAQILEKPVQKVKEKDRTWAIIKANLIDKGIVFEELSRKAGNRELQGKWDYTLTSTARGQNAIGNARYELDSDTKTQKQISKSLTEIIDEVGENTADFYSYMYHQLNIDRMTLEDRFGGDTGINYERKNEVKNKPVFGESVTAQMSREEVQKLEKKHPEFKEYAQDVYDYLDANTKELVDNGVISKETQQLFKDMYPHYVPISRIDTKSISVSVPLDTGRTGINSPIKKATGGSSNINPLFETMADRTLQTYRASARNNFGVELKNTLNKTSQLNQITQQSDIDTIMEQMTDEKQNNQLLQEGKNGENPTFTVFENGNKVTYEISKDMYEALKPKNELLAKIDDSKFSKIANKINNFRRGLLTEYNPVFSITNAIKDSQDILLNSQHSAKTYSKIPEATAQILSKGYWYNEYIQNGGAQNSYFKDGEFEVTKNNLPTKIKNAVTFPLRAISNVNNVIEMTPRLAEYIVSREQGRSIETSMLDASRVTTNFKAGGDVTKTLNRNGFTFLNASVQGMQQQIRNIQEANAKGLKGYAVLACKYAIAGVPVLLLNNLIWDDDEEYNELQDYVKDNYYIIGKLANGKFLRIPKGRAVATIQKIVSNANEFVKNDTINSDEVGKVFWEDIKENIKFARDNLAPNNPLENNIASPLVQVMKNKTWYGEDLVPNRLQNKPKAEQYDESTDKFSRWLGEKTGMSPIKINYLLDQYSGGAGDVLLPLGTPQAENNVIEDKFTTDSTMKSKYPGEFFSKVDELEINSNSSKATDEDILKYKYISSVSSEIGKLYKKKRDIQNSNETDEKKKSQLKEVQKQINKLAKNSLENVDKITKGDKYAQIDKNQYYKDVEGEWQKVTDKDKEKNKKSELSLKTYSSYKYEMSKVKQQKVNNGEMTKDQSLKNDDKIQILLDSNYSDKEKSTIYENYIKTQTKKGEYDSFDVIKASNIDIDEYLKFEQQDFISDKKEDGTLDGKTVSKSKQKKVVQYLNSMKIEGNQRLLLYAMQGYSTNSSQKSQLAQYVYNLKLDKDTKLELYNKFSGFKVYKDGRVQW